MIAERLASAAAWWSFLGLCLDKRAMDTTSRSGPGSSYRRSALALLTYLVLRPLEAPPHFLAPIEL